MLVVDQSGSTRVRRAGDQGGPRGGSRGGARAGRGLSERPGRAHSSSPKRWSSRAAAEGSPARAARHPRPRRFPARGRRTNLGASLTYAGRLLRHRSIVVVLSDFLADRAGNGRCAGCGAATRSWRSPSTSRGSARLPEAGWVGSGCGVGPAGAGRHAEAARSASDALAWHSGRRAERARALSAAGVDQVALVAGSDYAPIPATRLCAAAAPAASRMMLRSACRPRCSRALADRRRHDLAVRAGGGAVRQRGARNRRGTGRPWRCSGRPGWSSRATR